MRNFFIILALALFLAASPSLAVDKNAVDGGTAVGATKEKKHIIKKSESVEKVAAGLKVVPDEQTIEEGKFVMAIGDPEDSEMGLLGIAFQNYVAQASKGKMSVQLSYNGGLDADETFQFHRVQTGKLDMAMGGVGNITPMIRRLRVVTLPYLFPDVAAVVRGTTGKAADLLNSYAEQAGVYILAWTYYGYRYISNSKHPIKSLADMKGLRIRVPQNLVMIKTYRAFGATPVPVAWPATRSALRNDMVDGQCYDYNGFRIMQFQDAGQKFITEVHYLYNLQPLVINLKLLESLAPEDRKILLDAGKHIQNLSLQYQKEMNQVAKQALVSSGIQITTLASEDEWRQAALTEVWSETADSLGGPEAINKYLSLCDLPPWQPTQKKSGNAVKTGDSKAADTGKEGGQENRTDRPDKADKATKQEKK